jgi:hypothetical protein
MPPLSNPSVLPLPSPYPRRRVLLILQPPLTGRCTGARGDVEGSGVLGIHGRRSAAWWGKCGGDGGGEVAFHARSYSGRRKKVSRASYWGRSGLGLNRAVRGGSLPPRTFGSCRPKWTCRALSKRPCEFAWHYLAVGFLTTADGPGAASANKMQVRGRRALTARSCG